MVGADLIQMDQLRSTMAQRAGELRLVIASLESCLSSVQWAGADAERFRGDWTGTLRRDLLQVAAALEACAKTLTMQRQDQEEASSSGGSASVGGSIGSSGSQQATPGMSATANGKFAESTQSFVRQWEGKLIDADGAFGAQCFDVFRQYSNEIVGARGDIARTSNAAFDIYNHYETNGCNEFYDRIPAGQSDPQAGDIVVIGSRGDWDQWGHVALVTAGAEGGSIKILEQNYSPPYNGSDPAAVHDLSLGNQHILGYLRPKNVR